MSGDENPFKWAEGVGTPCLERPEPELASSSEVPIERGESTCFEVPVEQVGNPVDTGKATDPRWFDGVVGWVPGVRASKNRSELGDVAVKRNDLWEADWEVRVADSGEVDLEPKADVKVGRVSIFRRLFGRWL